jgi:hypothetical protein
MALSSVPEPIGSQPGGLDPAGRYWFGGRWWHYDYSRVAARLGKVTDASLALELGAPLGCVSRLRRQLGIPVYDKLAAVVPWLGRVPDRELARRHGVSAQAVLLRRRALGIKPASLVKFKADALLRDYVAALKENP